MSEDIFFKIANFFFFLFCSIAIIAVFAIDYQLLRHLP